MITVTTRKKRRVLGALGHVTKTDDIGLLA